MTRVAVVSDSASDLTPEAAAAAGITLVPLLVSFGEREYRTGVDIDVDEFYRLLTAPGAPFPRTAAASPGTFQATFQRLLDEGADEIVCVTPGGKLSATLKSAQIARDALPDRTIRVVDSESASLGEGLLALLAVELAGQGLGADAIATELERRRADVTLFVVLDTLEYLKRGGRISGARAAIGTMLSVKPIITLTEGQVEVTDRVRTRTRARARLLELLAARPVERIAVIHVQSPDVEEFAQELLDATGAGRDALSISPIGASVGPHVGPGAYGAVVLLRSA